MIAFRRAGLVLTVLGALALLPAGVGAFAASADEGKVELTLTVRDEATGSELRVESVRRFDRGTEAFEAMKQLVPLKSRDFGGDLGVLVTEICGVKAPRGAFWQLLVNGNVSQRGISSYTLDADTTLAWRMEGAAR
ncbi:MAG: DUF4430 domain-containing protein [Planctomycetota bacterium]